MQTAVRIHLYQRMNVLNRVAEVFQGLGLACNQKSFTLHHRVVSELSGSKAPAVEMAPADPSRTRSPAGRAGLCLHTCQLSHPRAGCLGILVVWKFVVRKILMTSQRMVLCCV